MARFRRQVRDAIERLDRQSAFISRLRSQAKISPQDELALNALSDRDPHHQAPLFQLYEQSSQMALGDLDSLLQARNSKVAATRPQSGSASSDDEDGEEEDGEEEEEEEEEERRFHDIGMTIGSTASVRTVVPVLATFFFLHRHNYRVNRLCTHWGSRPCHLCNVSM